MAPRRPRLPPLSPHRLDVQIDVSSWQAAAEHPITGTLVVENPGAAMNLTQLIKEDCEPGFAVIPMKGSFRNDVGYTASCTNKPFVIHMG